MSTKHAILELIRKFPHDVTLADIMAELCFRRKVDPGLAELDAGKGISHEQARERLQKRLR